MPKTINFCGDSFCASKAPESWTKLLADHLGYTMIGRGRSGSSHENAIKSFNSKADMTVFTWTHSSRLYYKDKIINQTTATEYAETDPVLAAAKSFYEHLFDEDYQNLRQHRELYWFDHTHLKQYKGEIVHLWCFNETYKFTTGTVIPGELKNLALASPLTEQHYNHMTKKLNHQLAKSIYKRIRKRDG